MPTTRPFFVCLVSLITLLVVSAAGSEERLAIVGATVIDVGEFGTSDLDLADLATKGGEKSGLGWHPWHPCM